MFSFIAAPLFVLSVAAVVVVHYKARGSVWQAVQACCVAFAIIVGLAFVISVPFLMIEAKDSFGLGMLVAQMVFWWWAFSHGRNTPGRYAPSND